MWFHQQTATVEGLNWLGGVMSPVHGSVWVDRTPAWKLMTYILSRLYPIFMYLYIYILSICIYINTYIYVCSYWVSAGQVTNFQGLISIWKPFFSSGLICDGVLKIFIRRCLAVTKSTGAFEEYLAWLITMITYLDVHPT